MHDLRAVRRVACVVNVIFHNGMLDFVNIEQYETTLVRMDEVTNYRT